MKHTNMRFTALYRNRKKKPKYKPYNFSMVATQSKVAIFMFVSAFSTLREHFALSV